jgi:hypothetical protein
VRAGDWAGLERGGASGEWLEGVVCAPTEIVEGHGCAKRPGWTSNIGWINWPY